MKVRGLFRYSPTRQLAVVVLLLAPFWLLSGIPAGFVAAVAVTLLLAAGVLLDAVFLPGHHEIRVERVVPGTVGIGDDSEGEYRVRSLWPRAVTITLHDNFPRALGKESGQPQRFVLSAGGTIVHEFEFVANERGPHAPGAIVLMVQGALGLVQRSLVYPIADSVLVAPSLLGIRRYRLLALQHRLRDAGVRAVRRRGQGTNFSHLREYARGDDPRRIDWKASARRSAIITREYTVEQGQSIMICLDAGRMMTQLAGDLSRFEYALSSALVLADVATQSRDAVGLMIFDDEIRAFVPPARGATALVSIRSALLVARANMVEPDYAMAFRTIAARHRKRSLIVLFSDVIDSRSSQSIIAHTVRSAVRHLPLVVALRNDHLMSVATPVGRTSSGSLFESAAAEELVSAREEALTRMRRAGVSVLDVSPQQMSAAVINRYLQLKARASL